MLTHLSYFFSLYEKPNLDQMYPVSDTSCVHFDKIVVLIILMGF